MKVTFLSLDDEKNKVFFESEASKQGNEIIFIDKTSTNTTIEMTVNEDEVKMVRKGTVNSTMVFSITKKTKGNYNNEMGLEFDFDIHCTRLEVSKNKILIHYTLILDEFMKTNHKISLLLN